MNEVINVPPGYLEYMEPAAYEAHINLKKKNVVSSPTMLLTVEQQLKYCGCVIALFAGIFAFGLSLFTIIYSFYGWREYDLALYGRDVNLWQESEYIAF